MANNVSRLPVGATPAKLALVGALGVTLAVVLYLQFGRSDANPLPPTEPAIALQLPAAAGASSNPKKSEPAVATDPNDPAQAIDLSNWQPPDLAVVVDYDPFALPESFPQPRPTDVEAALDQFGGPADEQGLAGGTSLEERMKNSQSEFEALRQLGVQVVLGQSNQYVALIGDRTVHVGDDVNGFTVIAIDPDGIRVARDVKP